MGWVSALLVKITRNLYKFSHAFTLGNPTLVKLAPVRFAQGSARRGNHGGRGGAVRGGLAAGSLLRNLAREERQEEEGESSDDADTNLYD